MTSISHPATRIGFLLAGCFLIVTLVGCGPETHESLAKKTAKTMNDICKTMDSVKDERTATLAASRLEKQMKRLKSLGDRARKLDPDPESAMKAMQIMSGSQMKFMTSMMSFQSKVMSNPQIAKTLEPVFKRLKESAEQ